MVRRTTPELRMPENGQGLATISAPEPPALQANARRSDVIKIQENTQLHIEAMDAHKRKAENWIEINVDVVDKSGEAFSSYVQSSEARVVALHKTMFGADVQIAEHSFRQSLMDGLSANIHSTARVTGRIAVESVLPKEEPPKGVLCTCFWSVGDNR